ncbi:baseplate hub protein [Brevundimonas sp.]|uniref:baseplate hub domain-containing protein n=1 Tax=Brevundimonas sp. TaxID=1871086 RepID=UPI003D6CEDE0
MRDISEELAARIESGAATLCHAWVLRRADGEAMGFTDHDRDLTLEGVVCRAGSGWTAGAGEVEAGLTAGGLSASGVLDDEAITEADIAAGLYDGTRVELWRGDWARPELAVRLWAGTLARIRRENGAFVADLDGPMAALERVVGRTYGRTCDAVLGDGRCRLSAAAVAGRGCDKRWATCAGMFGNGVNFQGFPDIPGDDFLMARPAGSGRNDGGSRR